MPFINVLREHQEEIPAWIHQCHPETRLDSTIAQQMLNSRIVYYPGSGCRDGSSFEAFTRAHAAHCVIHADCGTEIDEVLAALNSIRGYRTLSAESVKQISYVEIGNILHLDENRIPGVLDQNPMAQKPALDGAVWCILERLPEYGEDHGPTRIAFLHVKCEAAWLFWNLWVRRDAGLKGPFALIVAPEHGGSIERFFGLNGSMVYGVGSGIMSQPCWIAYKDERTRAWKEYQKIAVECGFTLLQLHRDYESHLMMILASNSGEILKQRHLKQLVDKAIVRNPRASVMYAGRVMKARWLEAEETISRSDYREDYLAFFPEARDDWCFYGWEDWLS